MRMYKILMFFVAIIIIGTGTVWAKYTYTFEETIIELTRDNIPPICSVSYSTVEPTNENVTVTMTANKEVEQVSGFQLSADKKVLTREFFQNESGILKIRDYSGNYSELEYSVENIDKSPPQIIGCENGGSYQAPLKLDYLDNSEITNIFVDKYSDKLGANLHNIYCDSSAYCGIDRTNSTLTINITGHPKNTKKYRYYINDKLYTTTTDIRYTFTGLEEGITYKVTVEALDEDGNILDTYSTEGRTSYFETIISSKSENSFSANFCGLSDSVTKIKYAVWNHYNQNQMFWQEAEVLENSANIICDRFDNVNYPAYVIHAYLYDKNGKILDVVGFSIDFYTNYMTEYVAINEYEITVPRRLPNSCKGFCRK